MTCKDVYRVFFQLCLLTGSTVASLLNVALRGTASQSSTALGGLASLAIDGNSNPNFNHGSCTHTDGNTGGMLWWRVRLRTAYRISSVSITNRDVLPSRIDTAEIRIGNSIVNNSNNNPICAVIDYIPSGTTRTFYCQGMIGQFVNVYLKQPYSVLTLCEVKVYGEPNFPSFNAVVMGQNVVVVEKKMSWSDAVLFCRDFYWDLLSIRSEKEQREVEEVLRNASFPLTKYIWLGLRRHLMEGTWFWMSGAAVNYSYWETNSIWEYTSPCGGVDTSGHWKDLRCGDNYHVICLTDCLEIDTRVEFFSLRPTSPP